MDPQEKHQIDHHRLRPFHMELAMEHNSKLRKLYLFQPVVSLTQPPLLGANFLAKVNLGKRDLSVNCASFWV